MKNLVASVSSVLLAIFGLASCPPLAADPSVPGQVPHVELEEAFPGTTFDRPVFMDQLPGKPEVFLVAEVEGRILVVNDGRVRSRPFIDIRDRVSAGGERGLLGFALHPEFAGNGRFYLSYTDLEGDSVVSRFVLADGGRMTGDPDSEEEILRVEQPFSNHNGGHIAFGPDGYLYIGLGDGGFAGDPYDHGQNRSTLLGALLRIDIDTGRPYAVPPDNPFAGRDCAGKGTRAACPEIYAWGLRNPWRWSFDRQTGDLWLGDVGQNRREEINIIRRGGNYGWRCREGFEVYARGECRKDERLEAPVLDYPHEQGYSVTGGYVYRGRAIPAMNGHYVYGDYGSGRIWGLPWYDDQGASATLLIESDLGISSFAEDQDGELYVLDFDGGGVYRVVGKK